MDENNTPAVDEAVENVVSQDQVVEAQVEEGQAEVAPQAETMEEPSQGSVD